jgi:hypothetical protein
MRRQYRPDPPEEKAVVRVANPENIDAAKLTTVDTSIGPTPKK